MLRFSGEYKCAICEIMSINSSDILVLQLIGNGTIAAVTFSATATGSLSVSLGYGLGVAFGVKVTK